MGQDERGWALVRRRRSMASWPVVVRHDARLALASASVNLKPEMAGHLHMDEGDGHEDGLEHGRSYVGVGLCSSRDADAGVSEHGRSTDQMNGMARANRASFPNSKVSYHTIRAPARQGCEGVHYAVEGPHSGEERPY
jgi:hypothetical protein